MKYKLKLLSVDKIEGTDSRNIGDYIQALASAQFYPQVDGFIDREELSLYNGEQAKVIMNGWYMHNPKNWPPSDIIKPLFVAFHINSSVKEELTSPLSISYLRKYEPIGCRDYYTRDLLSSKGIKAYFSGCMTLTLGRKFSSKIKDDAIYIVDPIIPYKITKNNAFISLLYFLLHNKDIINLYKNTSLYFDYSKNNIKTKIIRIVKISLYYRLYSKVLSRRTIMDSIYLSHESILYKTKFHTNMERLQEAERLVRLYARAKLVITSRIHCALPCLGLQTPVVFLKRENDSETSSCRMSGLLDLFNILDIGRNKIIPRFALKGKLSGENIPYNKSAWHKLADELSERCRKFVEE